MGKRKGKRKRKGKGEGKGKTGVLLQLSVLPNTRIVPWMIQKTE